MKNIKAGLVWLSLICFSHVSLAQASEEAAVKRAITDFFDGMRKADTNLIRSTVTAQCILQTTIQGKDGNMLVRTDALTDFMATIAKPHPDVYDERIEFESIKIDGSLASVWTPYHFYVGTKFSHCGVNSFQLVKQAGTWKIQYIIDTRRRTGCNPQ
jgi:hypothetical protein